MALGLLGLVKVWVQTLGYDESESAHGSCLLCHGLKSLTCYNQPWFGILMAEIATSPRFIKLCGDCEAITIDMQKTKRHGVACLRSMVLNLMNWDSFIQVSTVRLPYFGNSTSKRWRLTKTRIDLAPSSRGKYSPSERWSLFALIPTHECLTRIPGRVS